MKQQFIKVKIDTDKGIAEGCINVLKITAFRESNYDCNRTLVYTEDCSFCVYITFKELCKLIGVI